MNKEKVIQELGDLISPEGFKREILHSSEIWQSDPELFDYIFGRMNACTRDLIEAVNQNASSKKLRRVLRNHLYTFRRIDYDTVDAEFITDCFHLLAHIVNVSFGSTLMRWLYGNVLWALMKVVKTFKKEKVVFQKNEKCKNCDAAFSLQVNKIGSGTASQWVIGKCMSCNEYNLWDTVENSKTYTYQNFHPIEYLSKSEYSSEQANIRLEQKIHWGK